MESGFTKQVNIFFTFDSNNEVIPESRFLGVTFLDPNGNKSITESNSGVIPVHYDNMTDNQKAAFDSVIQSYVTLRTEV